MCPFVDFVVSLNVSFQRVISICRRYSTCLEEHEERPQTFARNESVSLLFRLSIDFWSRSRFTHRVNSSHNLGNSSEFLFEQLSGHDLACHQIEKTQTKEWFSSPDGFFFYVFLSFRGFFYFSKRIISSSKLLDPLASWYLIVACGYRVLQLKRRQKA